MINSDLHLARSFTLLLVLSSLAIATPAMANQIIEAEGDVSVRRNGASHYQSAGVGTVLNLGDLIRPASQARVTVLCTNNTTWRVPSGVPSGIQNGCPDTRLRFNTRGRDPDDFLEFLNQQFIYATQFLEPRPSFRWNAIANVMAYQIQVSDAGGEILWQQTVQGTEAHYDGDVLQPGNTYELQITALDRPNAEPFYLVFRILNQEEAASVQATVNELANADLTKSGEAIAIAQVYQSIAQPNTLPPEGAGLVTEAIPILEAAIESGSSSPYLHRLLGDLYLQVGLLEQATEQYQQVLNLTDSMSDLPSRATAQVGLANLAAERGDRVEAERWLRQARVSYQVLREGDRVGLIGEWIDKLKL
ncbi:MAG: hypothetical protein Kow00121_10510 [Elainellaceae cyanobacterium]